MCAYMNLQTRGWAHMGFFCQSISVGFAHTIFKGKSIHLLLANGLPVNWIW